MERKPRVSMLDVANAAGVSHSTASRALSGHPKVSDEARRAVEDAAQRLRYVRDLRASDLASARKTTLGLLIRATRRPFYAEVAAQIQAEADAHRIGLLIANGGDTEARQIQALQTLLGHGVGGMFIASGRASVKVVDYAASFVPTVTVGLGTARPGIDSVSIDARNETEVAERVVAAGHTHVAVTASRNPLAQTLHSRTASYMTALVLAGVRTTIVANNRDNDVQLRNGIRAAIDDGATAIMTGDDSTALHVLEMLRDWNLRCPEDISVTGFDAVGDAYRSPLLGLTTVEQPVDDIARHAVDIMRRRLAGETFDSADVRIAGRYIEGRTLGPHAVGSRVTAPR